MPPRAVALLQPGRLRVSEVDEVFKLMALQPGCFARAAPGATALVFCEGSSWRVGALMVRSGRVFESHVATRPSLWRMQKARKAGVALVMVGWLFSHMAPALPAARRYNDKALPETMPVLVDEPVHSTVHTKSPASQSMELAGH